MFDFSGKTAAITGGTKGIGRAITKMFLDSGANVGICSRSYTDEILAEIAGGKADRAFGTKADIASLAQIDAFLDGVEQRFGRIDILVNDAGINPPANDLTVGEDEWDAMFDINVKGCFFTCQNVLKRWVAKGQKGVIVNVSSIAGQAILPQSVAYCASKAAVTQMTRCLAKDFGKQGIRVNAVGPGSIPTDINKALYAQPGKLEALQERLPLSRQGDPEEIANAVLFLASDQSAYTTGQVLYVEGGWLLV